MKLPIYIREYLPGSAQKRGLIYAPEVVMIWDQDKNRIAEAVLRENAERIVEAVNSQRGAP